MNRYKGRSGFKEIARLYPHVVEIAVPPGGLGRRLDDMYQFHLQRGIKDQRLPRRRDDQHDYGALRTSPRLKRLRQNFAAS